MDLRELRDRRVQWAPSGLVMPIEDDQCGTVTCAGVVVEIGTGDETGMLHIWWETICERHDSQSPGDTGRQWMECHRAVDIALI